MRLHYQHGRVAGQQIYRACSFVKTYLANAWQNCMPLSEREGVHMLFLVMLLANFLVSNSDIAIETGVGDTVQ
jgi:hypothetical protein